MYMCGWYVWCVCVVCVCMCMCVLCVCMCECTWCVCVVCVYVCVCVWFVVCGVCECGVVYSCRPAPLEDGEDVGGVLADAWAAPPGPPSWSQRASSPRQVPLQRPQDASADCTAG